MKKVCISIVGTNGLDYENVGNDKCTSAVDVTFNCLSNSSDVPKEVVVH